MGLGLEHLVQAGNVLSLVNKALAATLTCTSTWLAALLCQSYLTCFGAIAPSMIPKNSSRKACQIEVWFVKQRAVQTGAEKMHT
eukprot:6483056-Amphidinium_carterae.1